MSIDYGIKVSKTGAGITSNDIRDIIMSSKYPMLKYNSDNLGTITLNIGDTEKHVDFFHSLGYVPAFISYTEELDGTQRFLAQGYDPAFVYNTYSFADSSKVRCGINYDSGAYGQVSFVVTISDVWDSFFSSSSDARLGKIPSHDYNAAMRFTNVAIPQGATIVSAALGFFIEAKGPGSGDLKAKYWGIAEDNTGSFSSSPMGRTKTTAVTSESSVLPAQGQFSNHNVITQVQEIVNRGGWSSGNAMGFIMENNGSNDDVYIVDTINSSTDSTLSITYNSSGSTTLTFRAIIFKDKIA